jgi:hypothetical protein
LLLLLFFYFLPKGTVLDSEDDSMRQYSDVRGPVPIPFTLLDDESRHDVTNCMFDDIDVYDESMIEDIIITRDSGRIDLQEMSNINEVKEEVAVVSNANDAIDEVEMEKIDFASDSNPDSGSAGEGPNDDIRSLNDLKSDELDFNV